MAVSSKNNTRTVSFHIPIGDEIKKYIHPINGIEKRTTRGNAAKIVRNNDAAALFYGRRTVGTRGRAGHWSRLSSPFHVSSK
jgi:hypothetical protein